MTGRAVSLFSGVGGLDLAVTEVFGAHPVAFCEFEKNPSKVLARHWPGVPNLGDVREAKWEDWAGVDVLHGGPPCQPTSSAGKRKGESDDRWMWPAALDAMRRVRPRWVVWENPSALLGLGDGEPFGRILSEMASMGYMGSYGCLRASDVGCCHGRDRVFILGRIATDADLTSGEARPVRPGRRDARRREPLDGGNTDWGSDAAHPNGTVGHAERGAGEAVQGPETVERPGRCGGVDWGDYAPAIARHAAMLGRPAPAPVDDRGRLSAHLVEWMMAMPEGWVTDVLPRNPALKALGNVVVRPQAAQAMRLLLARVERITEPNRLTAVR